MDRINGADTVDIGGGKRGFRGQNRAAGVVGTEVTADWLNAIQEEMAAVIESESIALNGAATNQLLAAINAKIESVRVNLPIYPDVLTATGKLTVTSPGVGVVRLGGGEQFVHRGGRTYTTVQTDFVTSPNKIYHMRWRKDGGVALYDLASLTYNSGGLVDEDSAFDTGYDDMMIARVVTNSANVVTPTPLINKARLSTFRSRRLAVAGALNWIERADSAIGLNWARTPIKYGASLSEFRSNNTGPNGAATSDTFGIIRACGVRVNQTYPPTRYQVSNFEYYYEDSAVGGAEDGLLSVLLTAEAD